MLRIQRAPVLLTFVAFAGFMAAAPRSTNGQARPKVVRIPDAPTCASCSVVLQPIAILGGQEGPGEIDRLPLVIREDGLGRFWILPGEQDLPRVYGAKGAYIGTVGRKGAGPGEFSIPVSLMPLPGDSMLVVDDLASRATVVGADLKAGRTMMYPRDVAAEVALEWPRSVLLQGWIPTGKQAGRQLHRASLAGRQPTILQSFSPDSSPWRRQSDWPGMIRAVPGRSGFWSYNPFRYRFTHWSADGKMIADFERDAGWFPRKDRLLRIGNKETPPAPTLVRIIPGDEQRVWTIVNVPSPNWRDAWVGVDPSLREIPASSIAMEHLFHTIVEEIDLPSGRVLSRTRVAKWIIGALDGDRVAAYEVDLYGVPRVVVYALVRRR